jgi:hypothetical protein
MKLPQRREAAIHPVEGSMPSVSDNPYQTPAAIQDDDRERILGEAQEIKAGIRRDRRSKTAWYGLAVFSFVPAPVFMCACGPGTLLETIRYNPVSFSLLALTLVGIIGGFHRSLRIARSRRQLNTLADAYEAVNCG